MSHTITHTITHSTTHSSTHSRSTFLVGAIATIALLASACETSNEVASPGLPSSQLATDAVPAALDTGAPPAAASAEVAATPAAAMTPLATPTQHEPIVPAPAAEPPAPPPPTAQTPAPPDDPTSPPVHAPAPKPNQHPGLSLNDLVSGSTVHPGIAVSLANPCDIYNSDSNRPSATTSALDAQGDGTADDTVTVFEFDGSWFTEMRVATGNRSQQFLGTSTNSQFAAFGAIQLGDNTHQHAAIREELSAQLARFEFRDLDGDGCLVQSANSAPLVGFTGSAWHSLLCDADGTNLRSMRFESVGQTGSFDTFTTPILANGGAGQTVGEVRAAHNADVLVRGTLQCPVLRP